MATPGSLTIGAAMPPESIQLRTVITAVLPAPKVKTASLSSHLFIIRPQIATFKTIKR